jgi:hypothetical protein
MDLSSNSPPQQFQDRHCLVTARIGHSLAEEGLSSAPLQLHHPLAIPVPGNLPVRDVEWLDRHGTTVAMALGNRLNVLSLDSLNHVMELGYNSSETEACCARQIDVKFEQLIPLSLHTDDIRECVASPM